MASDFGKYMPVVSSDKLGTNCHDCGEVLREQLTFTPTEDGARLGEIISDGVFERELGV